MISGSSSVHLRQKSLGSYPLTEDSLGALKS
ncbi:hypothetical protein LINPERPRIM_LOCUS9091 [Linum perenne]